MNNIYVIIVNYRGELIKFDAGSDLTLAKKQYEQEKSTGAYRALSLLQLSLDGAKVIL